MNRRSYLFLRLLNVAPSVAQTGGLHFGEMTMPLSESLSEIPPERFPRHIAVIMDGNARWAVRRGLERVRGHQQGARSVKSIVTECARLRKEHGGPDFLTLYSFSLENWKRPVSEVSFLMEMYIE